jgi:hypothetical protein
MIEWARPPEVVSKLSGAHRFVWDMRQATTGGRGGLGMAAIWNDTPVGPRGAMVGPGQYRARLTVDGAVQEQSFELKADPRG